MTNPRLGSTFEEFLKEEGIFEEADEIARRRVIIWQLEQARRELKMPKTEMARRMGISRYELDRILNGAETGIEIAIIERGAKAVGKRLKVELE